MGNFSSKCIYVFALLLTFYSCSNTEEFTIEKNRVGLIDKETRVKDIDILFKNDSVVKRLSEGVLGYKGKYAQEDDFYLIYSKEGKHLLTLTPKESLDSMSNIRLVEVHDPKFVTKIGGVGLNSKFEEINLAMNISKIESTFTKVVLFFDQMNATITLDKLDLGISTIQTNDVQIEQIPNLVQPKSFIIWFD